MSNRDRTLAERVKERDGHTCNECGTTSNLHAHHIVPLNRGGSDTMGNMVTLCQSCHGSAHEWDGYRVGARRKSTAKRIKTTGPQPGDLFGLEVAVIIFIAIGIPTFVQSLTMGQIYLSWGVLFLLLVARTSYLNKKRG